MYENQKNIWRDLYHYLNPKKDSTHLGSGILLTCGGKYMVWEKQVSSSRSSSDLQRKPAIKGIVLRGFRPLVFFRQTVPLGPLIHGLKRFLM
jgi:hypothetical protein